MNEYNVYARRKGYNGMEWVYVGFIKADSEKEAKQKMRKFSMRVRTGDKLKVEKV
jgi:hypothetical protein